MPKRRGERLVPALILVLAAAAVVFGAITAEVAADAEPGDEAELAHKGPAPVVLELFTSQGCSSCPPADRLLRRLAEGDLADRVVPLSFHVDYWNYIGWTDPFSSKKWSERQEAYARQVFSTNRIYTPQMVVGGRVDCNGADEGCVRRAVEKLLAREPAWRVELGVSPEGPVGPDGESLAVSLRAVPAEGKVGAVAGEGAPNVVVVVYETGLVTPVGRGENARRTLANDGVVRRLVRLESPAHASRAPLSIPLGADWKRENLGLAAFVQDPLDLTILGSAQIRPGELPGASGR